MTFEDDVLEPGFCFLRVGSGAKAKGEAGSGSAARLVELVEVLSGVMSASIC